MDGYFLRKNLRRAISLAHTQVQALKVNCLLRAERASEREREREQDISLTPVTRGKEEKVSTTSKREERERKERDTGKKV